MAKSITRQMNEKLDTGIATPGPWKMVPTVHTERKNIFGTKKHEEYHIGSITGGSKSQLKTFRANCALIEAAPEMLQVLKDVRMFMATNVPMTDGSPMHKAVKKLLARIEGVA